LESHRPKRTPAVKKNTEVCVELPNGLGLSDDNLKRLIDDWIVPQLIRVFVLETIPQKPVQSVSEQASTEADALPTRTIA